MPTNLTSQNLNLDEWTPDVAGNLLGLDKTGGNAGGGGGGDPVSSSEFTEDFNSSPLPSPWYDETSFLLGTNPDDASNCYRYEWQAGETGAPLSQTARMTFDASQTLDIQFQARFDPAISFSEYEHVAYVMFNTAPLYGGLGAGNGFALYIEPQANGQTQVQWRLSDESQIYSHETVGAPSWASSSMVTIRVVATLNTVGQADGRLKIFVNDVEYVSENTCIFRQSESELFGQFILAPYLQAAQASTISLYFDNLQINTDYVWFADTYPYDPDRLVNPNAYVVDPNAADNSGSGLAAEPWRDLDYALQQSYSPGDVIYLRNGTHVGSQRSMVFGSSGTAQNRIELTSYPGDNNVVVDCQGGSWITQDATNYWRFSHFRVINFVRAWNMGFDADTTGTRWYAIEGETGVTGENSGMITWIDTNTLRDQRADRCRVTFTGAQTADVCGGFTIMDTYDRHEIAINHCETSGFEHGVYHKQGVPGVTSHRGEIRITNSFLSEGWGSTYGHNWTGVYNYNNIYYGMTQAPDNTVGFDGGKFTYFEKCAFKAIGSGVSLQFGYFAGSGVTTNDNQLLDCLIETMQIQADSPNPLASSDYNLFINDINDQGTTRNLASWQGASGLDANSVQGAPTFAGSDFTQISSYQQTAGPGIGAASDGTDIGPILSKVGVLGLN